MDYEKKIQPMGDGSAGILVPIDLLRWLDLEIGDQVILRDEIGKHGKYASFWKNVPEKPEDAPTKTVSKVRETH